MTTRKWTFMVYMAGDNGTRMREMTSWVGKDIAELEQIGSTDDVAVVVQVDTIDHNAVRMGRLDESANGRSYRLYIPSIGTAPEEIVLEEQNTGDPATLRDFVVWAITEYPAERYALVLWNHGTGWNDEDIYAAARRAKLPIRAAENESEGVRGNNDEPLAMYSTFFLTAAAQLLTIEDESERGIAYDDSSGDFLTNVELERALREAEAITGCKLDLLGMDACLMNMIEVAYQLRACATVLVGSQEVEPMEGWDYHHLLQHLTVRPEMDTLELSRVIVETYGAYYRDSGTYKIITQTAIDLSRIVGIVSAMGRVSALLQSGWGNDVGLESAVFTANHKVLRFDRNNRGEYADLHHYLTRLKHGYESLGGTNIEFTDAIDAALAVCLDSVVANVAFAANDTSVEECAKGISIYVPHGRPYTSIYDTLAFAEEGWGDFLKQMVGKVN